MCKCLADACSPIKTVCVDGPGSSQSYSLELMWLFQIAVIITALLITWIFHSQAHYGPSIFPSFFFCHTFCYTKPHLLSISFTQTLMCTHSSCWTESINDILKALFFSHIFSITHTHTPPHTHAEWVRNVVVLLHTTCQWTKTAFTCEIPGFL